MCLTLPLEWYNRKEILKCQLFHPKREENELQVDTFAKKFSLISQYLIETKLIQAAVNHMFTCAICTRAHVFGS